MPAMKKQCQLEPKWLRTLSLDLVTCHFGCPDFAPKKWLTVLQFCRGEINL